MTDRWAEVEEAQVGAPDSPDHENPSGNPSPGRIERFLIRHRRTAAGRLTVRIIITLLGLAIIAGGIILLPLPGPGWVIIFGGLAVWSLEYQWAARLRRFAIRTVMAWTAWLGRQSWLVRVLVGLGLAVLVLGIIAASLVVSFGSDVFGQIFSIF